MKKLIINRLFHNQLATFKCCIQYGGLSLVTAREALKKPVQLCLVTREPGVGAKVVSNKANSAYSQYMVALPIGISKPPVMTPFIENSSSFP